MEHVLKINEIKEPLANNEQELILKYVTTVILTMAMDVVLHVLLKTPTPVQIK